MFKLIDDRVLEFHMEKSKFTNCLKANLYEDRNFLIDFFDFSDKQYFGKINSDEFNLRRKKSIFSTRYHCKTYGKINSRNKVTIVTLNSKGYDYYVYSIFLIIFLFILFLNILVIKSQQYEFLIFTFAFSFSLIALPIWILRKRLKKYSLELEKDLIYFTNEKNVLQHRV
jgi:hypothetical protein